MHTFTFRKIIREAPLFFVISTALCSAMLLTRFCIIPHYSRFEEDRKAYAYYTSLISSETGYTGIQQSIRDKIDSLRTKSASPSEQYQFTGDVSSYLENLIAIARASDISFVRMQPQEAKNTGSYLMFPVLLVVNTTYHELGHFISSLEKLPLYYHIDRLALDATDGGKCDVKLLLTCLIRPEGTQ